ncbi:methyl-accepting chemotaxis protein [Pullulanibacillus sp. KACC 23026]|uniref:methyl-accepting chemotaxis protein n=1 Tax=Pullulanibacillus sp. KACC 23026 TaxID=3028315 RepID=UPI0023AEDE7A|nr:methyl-accepting chemotaxis protein [Pullulanibacillus sp. KACC 23026]WEG12477.1 methyl-accepting chemotaxis protein [Pullulanibacillus sp. KACC 23026]
MNKLETIIMVSDVFHKLIPYAQLVVTDKEGYIHAISGDDFYLDVFGEGKPLLEGSIGKEVVTTGQVISRIGNKQLTGGIPYQGTGVPIISDGSIVGSMCVFISTENKEILQNAADELLTMMQTLNTSLEGISHTAAELQTTSQQLVNNSKRVEDSTVEISQVANVIAKVSSQTNLIGLNAAIEASRAGEQGKGFSVVANEIRRLSQNTKTSSTTILNSTDHVIDSLNQIQREVGDLVAELSVQTKTINATSETLSQIVTISEKLAELARIMVN